MKESPVEDRAPWTQAAGRGVNPNPHPLQAEVDRLTRERDAMRDDRDAALEAVDLAGAADAAGKAIKVAALTRDNEALREALRDVIDDACRDGCRGTGIKRGGNDSGAPCAWEPCIRARTLLAPTPGSETTE
jgi:outer membrane murein-binding lipoprotein Lpp